MRRIHMGIDIQGILNSYKNISMDDLFNDDNDKPMSDEEARKYLAECQKKGWKLLPMNDECEGFDHFGDGCPGHKITKQEQFDEKLIEIITQTKGNILIKIPGVYEILSEHFNNEVLKKLGWKNEP